MVYEADNQLLGPYYAHTGYVTSIRSFIALGGQTSYGGGVRRTCGTNTLFCLTE
jgi:hypothetical protein